MPTGVPRPGDHQTWQGGFRRLDAGYHQVVSTREHADVTRSRSKALLVFFYSPTSGPSRRMDGLISWLYVRERRRLRVRLVNVELSKRTAERYRISTVPTILLIKGRDIVARLEGRATGQQIDDAVLPSPQAMRVARAVGSRSVVSIANIAGERDPPRHSRLSLPCGDLSLKPTRHLDPRTLGLEGQQLLECTPVVGEFEARVPHRLSAMGAEARHGLWVPGPAGFQTTPNAPSLWPPRIRS